MSQYGEDFCRKHHFPILSGIVPGVMAQTGMETAEILRGVFEKDAHYRIGGDEFVVIVKHIDEPSVKARLEDLDRRLQQGLECGLCRVSMGYARVDPSCNNAVEAAFSLADANMYRQKQRHKRQGQSAEAGGQRKELRELG